VDFRILGPLEVIDRGRPVELGGPRQRAVLTALILSANRDASADRLIDDLWGERPPASARTTLHVYVSRLRKVLGTARITTHTTGYALALKSGELDAERFEQSLAAGVAALAEGRAAEAAETLTGGLAEWRGPALADVAYDEFAQAEIARLEDLRLTALEERFEAELALDRSTPELVSELEALVTEHPLRERLRGQLMLALYRAGRQAEALDAYRSARETLADELGLEPGAPLQRLERAILNHEPELEARAPAVALSPLGTRERKLVTVLLADLSAVPVAEDAERRRSAADAALAGATDELEAAGATVQRIAGEQLLGVFGAPIALEDHAERALRAAQSLSIRFPQAATGVESGEVLVDRGGGEGAFVSGGAVTAAARLARGDAGVNVGPRTEAAARKVDPTRAATSRKRAFVGREAELERLLGVYREAVVTRETQRVTVVGEPGVGKTRLVAELERELSGDPDAPLVRRGRCVAWGRGATYAPLAEVLRAELGLRESAPEAEVRRRLRGRDILGLTLGLDIAGDLDPRDARDRLYETWIDLLGLLAADRPLVLVVEDVHWAHEDLLELLARIEHEVRARLLVVVTARPEARIEGESIGLEPLTAEESRLLLRSLTGGLQPALEQLVLPRAEGNPFFIEELVSSLIDRGALVREGRRLVMREAAAPELPDSIHAVVAARIDLLDEPERAALQAAAVIGRTFWEEPVRKLVAPLRPNLAILATREFVYVEAGSSLTDARELTFKHAVTREVAYGTLAARPRAHLHAAFAEWLEQRGGGRDEHAPLLAHHYAEAVRPEENDLAWHDEPDRAMEMRRRAALWLRRAADAAVSRFGMLEAVALLRTALELVEEDPERIEIWRAIAYAQYLRYDSSGYREAVERALELNPQRAVAAELYAELAFQALGRQSIWKEAQPRDTIEFWSKRAFELAEPGTEAHVNALLSRVHDDPTRSEAAADEALATATRLDRPDLIVHALEGKATVANAVLRLDEARVWCDRQLALVPALADRDLGGSQYWHAAFAYLRLGRFAEVREFARVHDTMVGELTPHHFVHATTLHVIAETLACRWNASIALTSRAETAAAANLETPCAFNWRSLLLCALAYAVEGDDTEARRLEERAREIARLGQPAATEPALLRLALLRGDVEAIEGVLETLRPRGGPWDVDAAAARLDALSALGDTERVEAEAAPWLELECYTQPFAMRAVGVARGDASLLDRAAVTFEALGLGWHAARTRAAR
jgi:DNA-binding SARP family transcriptional activator